MIPNISKKFLNKVQKAKKCDKCEHCINYHINKKTKIKICKYIDIKLFTLDYKIQKCKLYKKKEQENV